MVQKKTVKRSRFALHANLARIVHLEAENAALRSELLATATALVVAASDTALRASAER